MLQKIPLLFPFLTTNQALLDREPFWEGKQDQEEMREELEKGGEWVCFCTSALIMRH